jgi:hypothetical protein
MQPEREVDPPSRIRHQRAFDAILEIHAQTAATHHTMLTGAGASAPDVRQGALGGRRARLDVVTSGSGSGRAFPARPRTQGRVDTKDFTSYNYTCEIAWKKCRKMENLVHQND